eukprot:TRINITY_DN1483_c0_g1_i2.p1 TRINITY_DN1483_c0_g1~~TRINITY_DN1483_c0_g1_i2.p1  ORF type:complete len:315 (+),score=50.99 TRINITY_DN1483_c0_g1_i2:86-1030(+)
MGQKRQDKACPATPVVEPQLAPLRVRRVTYATVVSASENQTSMTSGTILTPSEMPFALASIGSGSQLDLTSDRAVPLSPQSRLDPLSCAGSRTGSGSDKQTPAKEHPPRLDILQGLWCERGGQRLYRIVGLSITVVYDTLPCTYLNRPKQITIHDDGIGFDDLHLVEDESSSTSLKWQRSGGRAQIWRRPRHDDTAYRSWKHAQQHGCLTPSSEKDPLALSQTESCPTLSLQPPTKSLSLGNSATHSSAQRALQRAQQRHAVEEKQQRYAPDEKPPPVSPKPMPEGGKDRSRQGKLSRVLRGLCCGSAQDVHVA